METGRYALFAAVAIVAGLALQGCGGGSDGPHSGPTPAPTPAPGPSGFRLHPIEVKGQHLYDTVTNDPFFAVGIGFPNSLPNDIQVWIEILQRIAKESEHVNMVRLYEVPSCIWDDSYGSCFTAFMQEADKLGIYVLLPGTGADSGYIPRDGWTTAQDCYEKGKALNMGRGIVQRAYYPNTLAIVIGNEFFMGKDTFKASAVFKAYARDMKAYMKMCHDDESSPSHGSMRQIPVMYAARDMGDTIANDVMNFMKCGSADISIDIFGLNVERWCDPHRMDMYDGIHAVVKKANLPGVFMFSEMGCPGNLVSEPPPGQTCRTVTGIPGKVCPRNWNQVPPFFENFPMFDGFNAYAYWNNGALNFNMFAERYGNSSMFDDGANFFNQTKNIKTAERPVTQGEYPTCATQVNGVDVLPLDGIKSYEDDKFPANQCPSGNHQAHVSTVEIV